MQTGRSSKLKGWIRHPKRSSFVYKAFRTGENVAARDLPPGQVRLSGAHSQSLRSPVWAALEKQGSALQPGAVSQSACPAGCFHSVQPVPGGAVHAALAGLGSFVLHKIAGPITLLSVLPRAPSSSQDP